MLSMMPRLRSVVTRVLLLPVLTLLPAGLARAGGTPDQSQPAQNSWGMIGGGGGTGEVFTASLSGYLDHVSLYLGQYTPAPGTAPVLVSIETVTIDGLPSGVLVGHGQIPANKVPATGGWVDADIEDAFVIAGTRYALLVSTPDGIVAWYMEQGGDVKPYVRGYWVSKATGTWEKILTNQDWTFRTYVAVDTLDQRQSQTSGVGGSTRALGTTPVGQTFKVGRYGILDRVAVYLTNASSNPGPITVTIVRVGSTGLPVIGTEITSGVIPADAIPEPTYRAWVSAAVEPVLVTPGSSYAMLLSTSVSGAKWILVSDAYPDGTEVVKNGTSWVAVSSDFAFQTYVVEPILDQSQPNASFQWEFDYSQHVSQSFTAHVTGILRRISVPLDIPGCWECLDPQTDITVGISYVGGGGLLGSTTIPRTWLPRWTPTWIDVSIDGVFMTAGNQYVLRLEEPSNGAAAWYGSGNDYSGGSMLLNGEVFGGYDMGFKTYVLPRPLTTTSPNPGGGFIMPCVNDVCPATRGGFTPADLTDGVTARFQFQERVDGTVDGMLNFNDPRPDGLLLRGCTTQSGACALSITGYICSANKLMIDGTYTAKGRSPTDYQLTVKSGGGGPPTFHLESDKYSFTLTLDGIANVTCPTIGGE